jgi:iron complex outermembrane recepter protein
MRKFIVFVSLVLLTTLATAQQIGKVSVTIINEQSSPVENATIELLRSKDSLLVKSAISGNLGKSELENIKFDSYIIRASSLGLKTTYTNSFAIWRQPLHFAFERLAFVPN